MKEFRIDPTNTRIWDPDAGSRDVIPERFRRAELGCIRLDNRFSKPESWLLDGSDGPDGIRLASAVSVSGRVYDADAYLLSVCPTDSADPLAVRAGWLIPEKDTSKWRRQMAKRLTRVARPDGDVYWTLKARDDDDTDSDENPYDEDR